MHSHRLGPLVSVIDIQLSGSPLSFHRAVVQKVLLKHISPTIRCHLSRQLVTFSTADPTAPGSIHLTFADGHTASCDVLVGADGIKSTVRRQLVRQGISAEERPSATLAVDEIANPVWSGTIAYRFLVDSAVIAQEMRGHRVLTTHVVVSSVLVLHKTTFVTDYSGMCSTVAKIK